MQRRALSHCPAACVTADTADVFGWTPPSPAHFASCGAPPNLRHSRSQQNCSYSSSAAFGKVGQVELEDKPSRFQAMSSLWGLGYSLFQGAQSYLGSSWTPSAWKGESQASSGGITQPCGPRLWLRFRAPWGASVESSRARAVPLLFVIGETERRVS